MDLLDSRRHGQGFELERDLDDHALGKTADSRGEERAVRQQAVRLHLGHMLVVQAQRVDAIGVVGVVDRRRVFKLGDHGLPAARIAGDGVDSDRPGLRDQPVLHQGTDQGDETGGIAAGIGHARRGGHRLALRAGHLRKAVGPAGRHPVGG